jgi:gliding motility-associated protein GldC
MITKNIQIEVELDENHVPQDISWQADDSGSKEAISCRSMILALWDHNKKDTLRLDLWTKDMTVDEMKIFFHQTLVTMADTLERSIADERIAGDMRDFCAYFAEKMEIAE